MATIKVGRGRFRRPHSNTQCDPYLSFAVVAAGLAGPTCFRVALLPVRCISCVAGSEIDLLAGIP